MSWRRGLVVTAVAAAGILTWRVSTGPADTPSADPALAETPRFAVGRTATFEVGLTDRTEVTLSLPGAPSTTLVMGMQLGGQLRTTTLSVREDATTQAFWLQSTVLRAVHEQGTTDLPALDVRGKLTRDSLGAFTGLELPSDTSEDVSAVTDQVLRALLVAGPPAAAQDALHGEWTQSWMRQGPAWQATIGSLDSALGQASHAATATGDATLTWSEEGPLASYALQASAQEMREGTPILSMRDEVHVQLTSLSDPPVRVPPTGLVARLPRAEPDPADVLRRRADGMSTATLTRQLLTYDGGDSGELMWRGTARLALDPSARDAVAAHATAPSTPHIQRELALDLLTYTPHPSAQDQLRDALASDVLTGAAHYPQYVQRLGLVPVPSEDSAAWLLETLRHDNEIIATAAGYAAGAMASRAEATGQAELADALVTPLRDAAADSPSDHDLLALANADDPADVDLFLGLAADTNQPDDVRHAATTGLRGHDVSQDVLLQLAADASPQVQRAAWLLLAESSTSMVAVDGAALMAAVSVLHGTNLGVAVTTLAPAAGELAGQRALHELLLHPRADPATRARIRGLLRDAG